MSEITISSETLGHFKIGPNTEASKRDVEFMLDYVRALMYHSDTPELRGYWTVVYKYLKIKLGVKKYGNV